MASVLYFIHSRDRGSLSAKPDSFTEDLEMMPAMKTPMTETANPMGMMMPMGMMPMMSMPMGGMMPMMMPMTAQMTCEMTTDGMMQCKMQCPEGMNMEMFKNCCELMMKMMSMGMPMMMTCGGMPMMICTMKS